jgi:adenylate cyclase
MTEAPPDGYANELRREILRSEVQRVQMLAIVLSVLLAAALTATTFFPQFTHRMFRGGIAGWEPSSMPG